MPRSSLGHAGNVRKRIVDNFGFCVCLPPVRIVMIYAVDRVIQL